MTKQPTKLDGVLRQFEIWIGLMKLGATNSSAAEHALNRTQAKQAIYDLIEYVIGEDEDGRDSKVLEGTSCNAACHAIEHRLTKADQRKRAKELL